MEQGANPVSKSDFVEHIKKAVAETMCYPFKVVKRKSGESVVWDTNGFDKYGNKFRNVDLGEHLATVNELFWVGCNIYGMTEENFDFLIKSLEEAYVVLKCEEITDVALKNKTAMRLEELEKKKGKVRVISVPLGEPKRVTKRKVLELQREISKN